MSTTSSKNFTTLYSGSGSVVPQGAYGNANVVSLLNVGTDGANTVGNIVAAGNITAPSIGYNGLSQIQFSPIAGGPIYLSPATNAVYYPQVTINDGFGPDPTVLIQNTLEVVGSLTVPDIQTHDISATGNIVTNGYFIGNFLGNIGGNIVAAGANTQVQFNDAGILGATAGLTFNKSSNALAVIGNITGGNVAGTTIIATTLSAVGNVIGGNVNTSGVVSAAGNVRGANFNTTGLVSATGNVTGGNITTVGQVTATGNITGNYILGNGSQLTGLPALYGNANVVSLLASFGSNTISTTGNVTSGNLITSGNLFGNVVGQLFSGPVSNANVDIRQYSPNSSDGHALNLIANLVVLGGGSGAFATNTLVAPVGGSLEIGANRNVVAGGYIKLNADGNAEIAGWNGGSQAGVNLYGNTHIGGGVGGIGSATAKGNLIVANAVYVGESISAAGNISSAGNVTGSNIIGNGQYLSSLPGGNVTGTVALAQYVTDNAQANITSVGTLTSLSVSGNIDGGNLRTAGLVTATGNVSGGNVILPNAGKLRGDFSSSPAGGRTVLQTTSTATSAQTTLTAIPGPNHVAAPGTFGAATGLFSSNDFSNVSIFGMYSYPNEAQIRSTNLGSGNVNDVTFRFGSGLTLGASLTSTGNFSAVGQVTTGSFLKAKDYTKAALTAITGSIGQMAAVSDATPGGALAFWDTTNSRWSYVSDNSAV